MLPKKLANAIFTRDFWKCRHCHDRANLQPHHVIYKSQRGTDDKNNLLTLCAQCHRAHHDGFLDIEIVSRSDGNLKVNFTRQKGWQPQ